MKSNYSPLLDPSSPFHDLLKPYRFKTYYGGRSSAKSWSMAEALIRIAQCAKVRILCVRMTQNSIADSVHKLLCDTIERLGFSSDFEITKVGITSKTGSAFFFKGIQHDAVNLKSIESVDICWAEESATISEEGWRILIPTIRKEGSEIWQTFNTGNETDYTYQAFVVNPPPGSIVHHVNYDQNPHLPQTILNEIEYCKANDYQMYEHIWLGKPLKLSDAVIFKNCFSVREFNTPDTVNFLFALDFGYAADPLAMTRCYVHEDILYIDREVYEYGVEIDQYGPHIDKLCEKKYWKIYADSANPGNISLLKRQGYNIEGVKKWPGSVEDGISHIKSYKEVVIHPRCTNTIMEFSNYSWKVDKLSGDIQPIPVDKSNHIADCVRYALSKYILNNKTSLTQWERLAR